MKKLNHELHQTAQIQEKPQCSIAKADGGGLIAEGLKREMCLQTDTFYVMKCKWKFHLVLA